MSACRDRGRALRRVLIRDAAVSRDGFKSISGIHFRINDDMGALQQLIREIFDNSKDTAHWHVLFLALTFLLFKIDVP